MKNTAKTNDLENNRYRPKLNGYRCSHRNRWLLLNNYLTPQSFLLFEFYLDIFDFDYKHLSYGTLTVNFKKLAEVFDCSVNSIRNWNNVIINSGLIEKTEERGVYKILNPERYIPPGFWKGLASSYAKRERKQSVEHIFQSMSKKVQDSEENCQPIEELTKKNLENNVSKALGLSKYSSKVDYSNKKLSEDDKDWIDDHI